MGTLRLEDGRVLAYEEWGDPRGHPIIHFHGTPSSRLERYPDEELTTSMGVRFVTFDRPGYGASDPMPGRTLLDGASDVVSLADYLNLDQFSIDGISGGGPYALAAAWALSDRVTGAAVLAGFGPLDRLGAFDGMSPETVEEFDAARHDPDRLSEILANLDPASSMPEPEMAVLIQNPGLTEMLLEGFPEMTRQGVAGMFSDDTAYVMPWGFALEEISVPLHLWHGDKDTLVPLHHSEFVAANVSSAVLHRCFGEVHLNMFEHQAEVLSYLMAAAGDRHS